MSRWRLPHSPSLSPLLSSLCCLSTPTRPGLESQSAQAFVSSSQQFSRQQPTPDCDHFRPGWGYITAQFLQGNCTNTVSPTLQAECRIRQNDNLRREQLRLDIWKFSQKPSWSSSLLYTTAQLHSGGFEIVHMWSVVWLCGWWLFYAWLQKVHLNCYVRVATRT